MLNRLRKAMDERDKGFTLIELLVVIIIIGILAAIAIPVFLNQRKKGVDAGLKSDLKNAATQVETWITDNPQTAISGEVVEGTGADSTVGATTPTSSLVILKDFKVSAGNTVALTAGTVTGTYVLKAQNPNSSKGKDQCLSYDSNAGGVQAAWAAC